MPELSEPLCLSDVVVALVAPVGASERPELGATLARVAASGGPEAAWRRAWESPTEEDLPLVRLAEALALAPIEVAAAALARAIEVDPLVARLVGWVQAPVGGARPTVGLVTTRLAPLGALGVEAFVAGPALANGVLSLAEGPAPLVDRALVMPVPLVLALAGVGVAPPEGRWITEPIPLPPSHLRAAESHATALYGRGATLVIRAPSAAEGEAAAAAVIRALGARPARVEGVFPGLGPWLRVSRAIPVLRRALGPSERFTVPAIPGWSGPVLVVTGPDGVVEAPRGSVGVWALPVPEPEERVGLWSAHLAEEGARLGRLHRFGPGRIAALADAAAYHAASDGRAGFTEADVLHVAARPGDGLDLLAQPIATRVDDDTLVLSASVRADLDVLLARCRFREGLAAGLGPAAVTRYGPGVKALLVGPSGTGKTLAASWIATRLGMPLYRVDLAAVVSKYIGETEKNLAEMLARAESDEVVLLFDEADALFGKRTEVRQANDRFANSQTNYLLQRIEGYTGIVLLSSNSRSRFDPAFSRRLDLIVEFPPPSPEERLQLWKAHLGREHALTRRQLNHLAVHCDLAGGHIRNAVLAAAVLAEADGRRLGWAHAVRGVEIESRKLGMPLPTTLRDAP